MEAMLRSLRRGLLMILILETNGPTALCRLRAVGDFDFSPYILRGIQ